MGSDECLILFCFAKMNTVSHYFEQEVISLYERSLFCGVRYLTEREKRDKF